MNKLDEEYRKRKKILIENSIKCRYFEILVLKQIN